jgi:uncharacterized membrane protein YhaH (DUF805 family)
MLAAVVFTKSADTNLSALFAFFTITDKVKSVLIQQKRTFLHFGATICCFTLFIVFHCVQQRKTIPKYWHRFKLAANLFAAFYTTKRHWLVGNKTNNG